MSLLDKYAGMDIVGKTIAGVFPVMCHEILLVFTDGTHVALFVDCDDGIASGQLNLLDYRDRIDELLALGAVTQSEVDVIRESDKTKKEKEQELLKAARRAEYERLKKEFGE